MMILTSVMAVGVFLFLGGCVFKPGRMFPWFLLFLSAHVLIMTLAYVSGVHPTALRVMSAWKELALLAVVLYGMSRARDETGGLLARRGSFQPVLLMMVAFVAAHVVGTLLFTRVSEVRRPLLELRVILVMALAYYAGKVIAERIGVTRMLKHIVWVAVACSIWGIVELFCLDEAFWVNLGYPHYLRDFMGQHYNTASGVQENWYTIIGGTPMRRAMSVFMSSQPFAKMLIVAMPVALMLCVWQRSRLMLAATIITSLALLVSLTRACIVGAGGLIGLYLLTTTRTSRKTPLVVMAAVILVVLYIYSETVTSFWEESLSFEDPSSVTHAHVWRATAKLVREKPLLGHGAGTRAGIATRLAASPETHAGEQTYLIFASQYGLLGLLLYLALMITVMTKAIRLHKGPPGPPERRILGGALFIIWGTIILDSLTTYMWGSPYIAIVPWMLVGAADRLLATPARAQPDDIIDFKTIQERAA